MINNPTCLQLFQTGEESSTFTTMQPGQAWPEFRTTWRGFYTKKGNENNTVQQLCVTEKATPALGFTGTIVEKKKQPVVLDLLRCEGETLRGLVGQIQPPVCCWNTSIVSSSSISNCWKNDSYSSITRVTFCLPPLLAASFIYICAC